MKTRTWKTCENPQSNSECEKQFLVGYSNAVLCPSCRKYTAKVGSKLTELARSRLITSMVKLKYAGFGYQYIATKTSTTVRTVHYYLAGMSEREMQRVLLGKGVSNYHLEKIKKREAGYRKKVRSNKRERFLSKLPKEYAVV